MNEMPDNEYQPEPSAMADLDAERQKRKAADAARRKQIEASLRIMIEARGLNYPVRIRMAPLPADPNDKPDEIENCGNGVFLIRSASESRFYKVQKIDTKWTCSCAKWRKSRGLNCQHIDKVRAQLDNQKIPYATARRRPATRIFYPNGALTEETRRKQAYADWPTRCPQLFEELCRQIIEPVGARPKGGAPSVPLRLCAYALLTKVQEGLTYPQLAHRLSSDRAVQRLGWMKARPLSVSTLCAMFADERLVEVFKTMIETTAKTGRQIEDTAIIDASGLPNSLAANYNEEKYGGRRKRKGRTYLKPHWVTGRVTNLIPFVEFTLDYGRGSGDAPHYRGAARETKRIWTSLKRMLGDGSYGTKGNYAASERLGVELITREKTNERRSKWGGQAAKIAKMQNEETDDFKELYRFRSRGETPPARIKGHQSFQRLRRRVVDTILPDDPIEDDVLCDLADDELEAVMKSARNAVGKGQANEAYAQIVAGNVRDIVVLEHLHDERASLAAGSAFTPIVTIDEADLRAS